MSHKFRWRVYLLVFGGGWSGRGNWFLWMSLVLRNVGDNKLSLDPNGGLAKNWRRMGRIKPYSRDHKFLISRILSIVLGSDWYNFKIVCLSFGDLDKIIYHKIVFWLGLWGELSFFLFHVFVGSPTCVYQKTVKL